MGSTANHSLVSHTYKYKLFVGFLKITIIYAADGATDISETILDEGEAILEKVSVDAKDIFEKFSFTYLTND